MRDKILRKCRESVEIKEQFFSRYADRIGELCEKMARQFGAGRRLSPNLLYGLQTARKKGMLTIAFSGKDGGRIRELADYAFVVPSFSIHRIQECQVVLLHILWDLIHVSLGEEDVI
jgi:phosphoheptose isomerase